MKKIFVLILVVSYGLIGCKQENTSNNTTNQTPPVTTPVAPPPPTSYTASVNDLRVRETPSMTAKVLATLKQGDKMTATGNKSSEKITIDLRGQQITDNFVEVTTSTGIKGWVFGGAVTSAGSTSTLPATDVTGLVSPSGMGGITANSTEADIIKLFGKENITTEKEVYANGDVPPFQGLTIYKGKSDEFQLAWEEGKKGKKIAFVHVRKKGGKWHTAEGIKVGTTLAELNSLNGKPFQFSGFGWDYGGYISSWEGGKLESYKNGVSLRLDSEKVDAKYSGEVQLKSDIKDLLTKDIHVSEISVLFGEG